MRSNITPCAQALDAAFHNTTTACAHPRPQVYFRKSASLFTMGNTSGPKSLAPTITTRGLATATPYPGARP